MKIHFISILIGMAFMALSTSDAAAQTAIRTGTYQQGDIHSCGCGLSVNIITTSGSESGCVSAELFQDLPGMPAPPYVPIDGNKVVAEGIYRNFDCDGVTMEIFVITKLSPAQ